MTRALFAARVASLTARMAGWTHDTLTPFEHELTEPALPGSVKRFIREIRERLDYLEQELGE